jgi:hypothetical protein
MKNSANPKNQYEISKAQNPGQTTEMAMDFKRNSKGGNFNERLVLTNTSGR